MTRPIVSDYFDKDEKGQILSLDIDFHSYVSSLNEFIDYQKLKIKRVKQVLKYKTVEFDNDIRDEYFNRGLDYLKARIEFALKNR